MEPSLVAVVDIGSPARDRLGWATSSGSEGGGDLDRLLFEIAAALELGPVALGFESPLWIPVRTNLISVLEQRKGEAGRSWSASAGANSLCAGLGVVLYALSTLRRIAPQARASLDFRSPPSTPQSLFLFEAFVSGSDKRGDHCAEAKAVVDGFANVSQSLSSAQRLDAEPCLNILGALLLRTGWSTDLALLRSELLVLDHR